METLTFQAETAQLLDLVVHSLYTDRDIFLRELISNASDALDRFRLESLQRPALYAAGEPLEIWLEADPDARTLTVRDNGIGMSRREVVDHIGTIARSGTKELVDRLGPEARREHAIDVIGRFGVGFYSAFSVADRVVLTTRRADETAGTRWESAGDVQYTLDEAGDMPRGTAVTLHLKPVDHASGIDDYASRWVLASLVKRYADFVTYPVLYKGPEAATDATAEAPSTTDTPRIVLNSMRPIWTRRETDVKVEEYNDFFRQLAHDVTPPMLRMRFEADGLWQYSVLLYVPSRAPHDLLYHAADYGLQVYAKRVSIIANCRDVVPRYLRFLRGVVDVSDVPLHVSRETLQDSQQFARIRNWITRKVIEQLARLRDNDPALYLTFWSEFGRVFKEGVSEDRENKDRLLPLMLFASSADRSNLTTLGEYVSRMKPEQKSIYYATGESRAVVERLPHIEELLARGYEVLLLTEPVDELLVRAVIDFEGRPLRSAAVGHADFGDDTSVSESENAGVDRNPEPQQLIEFLAKHLEPHVRSVRVSKRLTVSPACLTGDGADLSPFMERLLLRGKGAGPRQRRILELNPNHPIVARMESHLTRDAADPRLPPAADLLLGLALLAEGSELPEPVTFSTALTDLLQRALD